MHLDDIRKVLQYCYGLQAESGPESAFRFAVFMGPKRTRLFANYPETSKTQESESDPNHRKKKDKGKQRGNALDGLLQIEEIEDHPTINHVETEDQQNTNPSAGPSNKSSRDVPELHQDGLVRIDMGQMLQLKDMGYEVMGPVNGPNEGYPEYEVPRAMLEVLILHRQSQHAPDPNEEAVAVEPD